MDPNTDQNIVRDQNVLSFMMQLVQEKHGDEIEISFLNQEADRLYNLFGDKLVSFFEPQLTEDQKKQFDELIKDQKAQDEMMNFLVDSIPDLEEQIMQILIEFRESYLKEAGQGQSDLQVPNDTERPQPAM
jgi:hypothetical protein